MRPIRGRDVRCPILKNMITHIVERIHAKTAFVGMKETHDPFLKHGVRYFDARIQKVYHDQSAIRNIIDNDLWQDRDALRGIEGDLTATGWRNIPTPRAGARV